MGNGSSDDGNGTSSATGGTGSQAGGGKRGVRMTGSGSILPEAFADEVGEAVGVVEEPEGLTVGQVVAIAVLALALAGVLLRVIPFVVGRKGK